MNLSEAINRIRPSIVQIRYSQSPIGTGFFVDSRGLVITARHVIRNQMAPSQMTIGLAMPNTEYMRGNFRIVNFMIIDEDISHDLILLKLRKNPFEGEVRSGFKIGGKEIPLLYGIPILSEERPKDGMHVAISGYPLREPVLVTSAGYIATSWAFKISRYASQIPGTEQWYYRADVADAYLADVEVNPGDSGAPVYSVDDAKIFGVCIASKPSPIRDQNGNSVRINDHDLFYSSGLTYVVPTKYVMDLLNRFVQKEEF